MKIYIMAREISTKVMEEMVSLGIDPLNVNNANWDAISNYQNLSEDFIREFQNKIDWNNIFYYQVLSEDFIREFQDKVNWDYISIHQALSEDFIREFMFDVNWENIEKRFPNIKKTIEEDILRKNTEIKQMKNDLKEYESMDILDRMEIL